MNTSLENNLLCTYWSEWVAATVWHASPHTQLDSENKCREWYEGYHCRLRARHAPAGTPETSARTEGLLPSICRPPPMPRL